MTRVMKILSRPTALFSVAAIFGSLALADTYNFVTLDVSGGTNTVARGINNSGDVVGFYSLAGHSGHHGFLYLDGSFATIDVPGATGTQAVAINDRGEIVGTFTDAHGEHGFLYVGGAFTTIDAPDATYTTATSIDNAGDIVGTFTGGDSLSHGFRYTNGVFSTTESSIDARSDVNDAGQIVGSYLDGSGESHGFLATPIRHTSGADPGRTAPTRAPSSTTTAASLTAKVSSGAGPCDVTGNGVITVADVQLIINEALGAASAANDLNGDHIVNVSDIQVVINAAMQRGCTPTAPQGTGAVAHLTVQSGNGQVVCDCITATLQTFQPISVKATDINGHPVAGATVNWTTNSQMNLAAPSSITDASGIATENMNFPLFNNFSSSAVPYLTFAIQAASNNLSVTFNETQSLITSQGASVIEANPPRFAFQSLFDANLSAPIGTTLSTPIQTLVAGLGVASNGVGNVSIRILNLQTAPTLTCVTLGAADPGSVLSDAQGNTNCYPTFNGSGTGQFYLLIGGVPGTDVSSALYLQEYGPYTFTSIPGAPAAVQIISGNDQVAPIGQALNPLVAKLVDAQGNVVPGQTMVWSVSPPGAASLTNGPPTTDNNGEITTAATLGLLASAGCTITVALQSNPAISATFTETIPGAITSMTKVSGDNQTAHVGANFANPLVIKLVNASGPVANFPVHILVSGPVLTYDLDDTDNNGQASLPVKAGATTGAATITVVAGALTQTFTLTVQ